MVNSVVKQVGNLAAAENRLWQITAEKEFADIPAKTIKINDQKVKVLSGEEVIAKIDAYFAKKNAVIQEYKHLDFLKDPEVVIFLKVHENDKPQMKGLIEKDFLAYANQYKVIEDAKKGMNSVLAEKTIAAVDELYSEGKYVAKRFNPMAILQKATDIELTDAKGLSHQLHKDNKALPRDKAYVLAMELLEANHISNAHKIVKGTAIHVPENHLETVYSLPPKQAASAKGNQK